MSKQRERKNLNQFQWVCKKIMFQSQSQSTKMFMVNNNIMASTTAI